MNSIDDDRNTALMSLAYNSYDTGAIGTAKTLLRLGAHVNKNSDIARKANRVNLQYNNQYQLLPLLIAAGETSNRRANTKNYFRTMAGGKLRCAILFFPL